MNLNILEQILKKEHDKVLNARSTYGEIYSHAENLLLFTWDFISDHDPDGWIFIALLQQIRKSLVLALFSAVRGHKIQMFMLLRYALENSVLACYSLAEPDLEKFIKYNHDGTIKNTIDDKAYKWIKRSYSKYSDIIKFMKDTINNSGSSHGNLSNAPLNYTITDSGKLVTLFFDVEDNLMDEFNIWWISNITFGLIDLFYRVNTDYPMIKFVDNFCEIMTYHDRDNERIKYILQQHPRFSKWYEHIDTP